MIGWVGSKENSLRYEIASRMFGSLEEISSVAHLRSSADFKHLKAVLLSENEFPRSLKELSFCPDELLFSGFCDGFFKEHDGWIPKCSYTEVFTRRLSKLSDYIDLSKGVLVVGDFEPARAALSALFKLGFKEFFILGDQRSIINDTVRRYFFGLSVKVVQVQDLINLSGEASVLLHGVRTQDKVVGEWELSYLNFLGRPGLLIDFLAEGFIGKVVTETQDEGLAFLGGDEIESLSLEYWKRKTAQSPVTKNVTPE